MEALLGRRALAMLENTVLVLIPVLIGLIAAEWLLERSGPLSAAQHRFFAWADLAVCSVFLFEVALRMALAPERGSYLLRHLLIDLLPSLPFGFVAHQIDLAEMAMPAAAAAGTGALEWLADAGRMAQVLRTSRLILPIARLARIALILLRLSDRLVRRMAGLLNRNIVLFEPLAAPEARVERPPPPAGAAGRAGARAGPRRGAARPRPAPAAGRARCSATSRAGSTACRPVGRVDESEAEDEQARDPRRGRGRAADPDDARAAGRPHGAGVRRRPSTAISACSTSRWSAGCPSSATWSPTARRARPRPWRWPPTTWAT